MKKLLILLLALLLPFAALAETYTEVSGRYLNTHGQWWDYDQALWMEFVTAAKQADPGSGDTGLALVATEYILPPAEALSWDEAAAIAVEAAGNPRAKARPLTPCFLLEDRAVYKVILYIEGFPLPVSNTVEMDALTGEVLGVYPFSGEEVGYFYVPDQVWREITLRYDAETLAQMSWSQLFDAYTARYGEWQGWNSVLWREFVAAVSQADASSSRTGRAVAATEYILPAPDTLLETIAAEIACSVLKGDVSPCNLVPCFLLEGRAVYKVILRTPDKEAACHTVELDAYTGEVLGVYPADGEELGQFFVPHAVWDATPETAPNG